MFRSQKLELTLNDRNLYLEEQYIFILWNRAQVLARSEMNWMNDANDFFWKNDFPWMAKSYFSWIASVSVSSQFYFLTISCTCNFLALGRVLYFLLQTTSLVSDSLVTTSTRLSVSQLRHGFYSYIEDIKELFLSSSTEASYDRSNVGQSWLG